MKYLLKTTTLSLAMGMALGQVQAQEQVELDSVTVKGKRANRASKGATGLHLEIKETPQSISIIDQKTMTDFGATGSNEALRYGTGINVEQYETNRATFNARGFEVQLTQVDGLGMSNDYGTVVGQQDTYLFDRIELIRGANGLLTGVGNASGTINYVRKRPINSNHTEIGLSTGSYNLARGTLDWNQVLTEDGRWASRVVAVYEDKDSHLRDLEDTRSSLYGVIDGQIGESGVLTLGVTYQNAKQKSPMWGSLTLNYIDGSMADFDSSASTSQKWAYWNTESLTGFIEYTHAFGEDWELKLTYNQRRAEEDVRLLYAFPFGSGLNLDNTGLYGWPYAANVITKNRIFDANINGQYAAFGREHLLIAGLSRSTQKAATSTLSYDTAIYQFLAFPAFPYNGDVYPEPIWGAPTPASAGEQALTRFYAATQLSLSNRLKTIVGVNAIKLQREGSSRYGNVVDATYYPDTEATSPYYGITYDFTTNVLGYASYSDIFQNQDQTDYNGDYLVPMRGVNEELGVKAEWLDGRLLSTFALFRAEQNGLATYAGVIQTNDPNDPRNGQYYYVPQDVSSNGVELEVAGRINDNARVVFGYTHLNLTGPSGSDIYEWVPRNTVNMQFDSYIPSLEKLRLGVAARWQSDVRKNAGAWQDAYMLVNAFAAYELNEKTSLRFNVNNLFDKKYVGGLAYGAIYGAPRNFAMTLNYAF